MRVLAVSREDHSGFPALTVDLAHARSDSCLLPEDTQVLMLVTKTAGANRELEMGSARLSRARRLPPDMRTLWMIVLSGCVSELTAVVEDVPEPDAGSKIVDAGTTPGDTGGTGVDAGQPVVDA